MKIKLFSFFFTLLILNNNFALGAKKNKRPTTLPERIQTSLVLDSSTGQVLHSENSKLQIFPASLTKLMTTYMIFEALEQKKISLHTEMPVSHHATTPIPGKLYLKAGERIRVSDALNGIIVKSANDASVVAAEYIGGSEENFAKMMTAKARQLGMRDTTFMNAHGLHHHMQKTTAVDLAKLSLALNRDFKKYYHLFGQTSFMFKGKLIRGHNRVTEQYAGATGLKTGFTNPAGYNLVTTATRNGRSLLGVVTGCSSWSKRNNKMISLLDRHFDKVVYTAGITKNNNQAKALTAKNSNKILQKSKIASNRSAKNIKLAKVKNKKITLAKN